MKYGNEVIELLALIFYGWLISFGAMSKIDMIATYLWVSLFWPVFVDRELYGLGMIWTGSASSRLIG